MSTWVRQIYYYAPLQMQLVVHDRGGISVQINALRMNRQGLATDANFICQIICSSGIAYHIVPCRARTCAAVRTRRSAVAGCN